jgi:hypothetical protein
MKINLLIILLIPVTAFSQLGEIINTIQKKEYSKEIAAFQAKEYLLKNILQTQDEVVRFEVDALSSAESEELTTLYYNCIEQKKEGLLLTFYGNYWNDAGVVYTGYGFKNLDKKQALEFLAKIQYAIDNNSIYLKENSDNNIALKYDDIEIIISSSSQTPYQIRLFWNTFDSSWDAFSFSRSKRRFDFEINKK